MNILVLTQDYPSKKKPYAMSYVHSRNIEYEKKGHNVQVVNFSTSESYIHEEIKVSTYSNDLLDWADIILSHAPNIRNHIRVLGGVKGKKIVFFFHGHEVLHQYGDYPKPYVWRKEKIVKKIITQIYDVIKIQVLKIFLYKTSKINSIGFIFVSSWMEKQFLKNVNIEPSKLGKKEIIPNACNGIFLESNYNFDLKSKLADFITIRPLDESKYAIDLVVEAACSNPSKAFHVYGKGNYFQFNKKPENLTVINHFINQQEIPSLLDKYSYAIMPTRYDAQGVMVCEMATYGIPVITTNFEVCLEMLGNFQNVALWNEEKFKEKLTNDLLITPFISHNHEFDPKTLVVKELEFFAKI